MTSLPPGSVTRRAGGVSGADFHGRLRCWGSRHHLTGPPTGMARRLRRVLRRKSLLWLGPGRRSKNHPASAARSSSAGATATGRWTAAASTHSMCRQPLARQIGGSGLSARPRIPTTTWGSPRHGCPGSGFRPAAGAAAGRPDRCGRFRPRPEGRCRFPALPVAVGGVAISKTVESLQRHIFDLYDAQMGMERRGELERRIPGLSMPSSMSGRSASSPTVISARKGVGPQRPAGGVVLDKQRDHGVIVAAGPAADLPFQVRTRPCRGRSPRAANWENIRECRRGSPRCRRPRPGPGKKEAFPAVGGGQESTWPPVWRPRRGEPAAVR